MNSYSGERRKTVDFTRISSELPLLVCALSVGVIGTKGVFICFTAQQYRKQLL